MTNVVITSLFTQHPDPQSGRHWEADVSLLTAVDSVHRHGWHAVVISDCLDLDDTPTTTFVRVDNDIPNAYWARWRHIAAFLSQPGDWRYVWCVDATDVVMLNDPAPHMRPGPLYIGSEPTDGPNARNVGFWWMRHLHPDHATWIDDHADEQLLNCGIVGGDVGTIREFASAMTIGWPSADVTDMAFANRIARGAFPGFITGPPVHTSMWSFVTADPEAWFAHK